MFHPYTNEYPSVSVNSLDDTSTQSNLQGNSRLNFHYGWENDSKQGKCNTAFTCQGTRSMSTQGYLKPLTQPVRVTRHDPCQIHVSPYKTKERHNHPVPASRFWGLS